MSKPPHAPAGFGLGLRTPHYRDFLESPQRVDWLEIISDNFLVEGGKPLVMLERIRRDYPMAMHGVAMAIGSAQGLDKVYLARIKQLADWLEPMWVSDHLCWTGFAPHVLHDLYPLPYTEECARLLVAQIRQAQDMLGRRLVLENVSSYVGYRASQVQEWEFLHHVLVEADCELLLDVNNVYVSSVNHGFSAQAYLQGIPVDRVRQIHLAGHSRVDEHIIDTHDHPVAAPVWQLYAQACQRFGQVATMIERDDNIPPLADLLQELDQARAIAAEHCSSSSAVVPALPAWQAQATQYADLLQIQQQVAAQVLDDVLQGIPDCITPDGILAGETGMAIYHHAYRARLLEVLADSYGKTEAYLGSELFQQLAARYIAAQPPRQRNLGRYGAGLADVLAQAYPDNLELADLARLEWALRTVFDAADQASWDRQSMAGDDAEACLGQPAIVHPTVSLLPVRSNALAIWQAIDADEDVPEAERWPQPRQILVWRKGLQPHFRSIGEAEAAFLMTLQQQGCSIAELADAWGGTPALPDPACLAAWLASWWDDALLSRTVPSDQAGVSATPTASLVDLA
ncbi:hypothetical protein GCM10007907_01680 [Chitinimonas prasina]|uniref:UPF0276 protein GCM10007907_01680 n=1 Tax=Chitinimonas prasina TaxID=1434937 RepID=A0ABQ5YCQ0_9NEIS|nr:DUF692 family multinuclear iron-containing protein [Chitinimonas prasina]GLR11378.1 hypothetical protein GCM10007907_01680 [Chitinimonas prasina]